MEPINLLLSLISGIKSETQAKEIEGFLDYDVYEEEEYEESYEEAYEEEYDEYDYDYEDVPVEE